MAVHIPPKRTRGAIAAMHRDTVAEFVAANRRVALLKAQKLGLMQRLLTGQVRVPEMHAELNPAAD